MDAMLKAIRAKREGPGLMGEASKLGGAVKEEKMDLDAIVSQLSEEDKVLLMEKLSGNTEEDASQKTSIDKGGMSEDEKMAIDAKILKRDSQDVEEDADEMEDGVDSDDIAMSMVGNRFKGVEDGNKPSNLSQRVQMDLAKKLKEKGKI